MNNNFSQKFKYFLLAGVSTVVLSGISSDNSLSINQNKEQHPVTNLNESVSDTLKKDTTPPTEIIEFKNDTILHYKTALLTHQNGKIIRNYLDNHKQYNFSLPLLSHEAWHKHNKKSKYMTHFHYSPSEYAQLRMYEEISATDASVFTIDLEYQYMKDKEDVIKRNKNRANKYYFDALENGEINPASQNQKDIEKKCRLIANEGNKSWCKYFLAHYTPSIKLSLMKYIHNFGFKKSHPANYKYIRSFMMTFGGIDLSTYLDEDIIFPHPAVKIFDELADVPSFANNKELAFITSQEVFDNIYNLSNFSDAKQPNALQHLFIATLLKYELNKLGNFDIEKNSTAVTLAYNKVMHTLSHDICFAQFVRNHNYQDMRLSVLKPSNTDFFVFFKKSFFNEYDLPLIQKFYTYRGYDLTSVINNFDTNKLPINVANRYDIKLTYLGIQEPKDALYQIAQLSTNVSTSAKPIEKHRYSPSLYCEIPNYEKKIFLPGVLDEEGINHLERLFKDYENIPKVFKTCDTTQQQKYVQDYGNPQYFTSKDKPFEPNIYALVSKTEKNR